MQLRPYQVEAVEAVERDLPAYNRVLVVMPTGTGKTMVIAEIVRRHVARGERVLVMTHRRELIEQAVGKIRALGLMVGIERARLRSAGEPVVVASVQTLREARLDTMGDFDLIVCDESHHCVSGSWQRVLAYYPRARVLGVTATPDRLDRIGLCRAFNHVAYHMTMRRAMAEGWLVPIRAMRVTLPEMDLSGVRTRRGDLHPGDLGTVAHRPQVVSATVGPLVELAGRLRTVVFAVDVAHAEALVGALLRRGVIAAVVHGGQPDTLRAALLASFTAGRIQFLVNAQLLVEGWDDAGVECVAMCRPTASRGWYTQAVGRGLRLHPGKTHCLVLDFVGVGAKHSLVGPPDLLGHDLVPVTPKRRATPRAMAGQRMQWVVGTPAQAAQHQAEEFDAMHQPTQGVVGWFKRLWDRL